MKIEWSKQQSKKTKKILHHTEIQTRRCVAKICCSLKSFHHIRLIVLTIVSVVSEVLLIVGGLSRTALRRVEAVLFKRRHACESLNDSIVYWALGNRGSNYLPE